VYIDIWSRVCLRDDWTSISQRFLRPFLSRTVDWPIKACIVCFLTTPDHPFLVARPAFVLCGGWCGALSDGATDSDYRAFGAIKPLDHFARPMMNRSARRGYRAVSRPLAELGLLQNVVISLFLSHDSRTSVAAHFDCKAETKDSWREW
jgi:hypothetical protein